MTDAEAIDRGWVVDFDENGRKIYIDPEGNVIDAITGSVMMRYPTMGAAIEPSPDWFSRIGGLLTQGLSFAQAWQQQKAFNEANKVRAAQGLPPLPWTEFKPTASVGVTLDPRILWTVLGVGALIALAMLGGRR
jgi:hypothetical protein